MRVIFLGTTDFSVEILKNIQKSRHEVVGVVTQPDRINGRNKKITFCPVKVYSTENNFPVFQFANISAEGEEILRSLNADIMVTAAYGQILKKNILDVCQHGIINVHASYLPKYRGSSPVQWAIINGEKEIGVTIMQTEIGVDTGDMILSGGVALDGDENSEEALKKVSVIGGKLLCEALDLIEAGKAVFTKQDESAATRTRMFDKDDEKLNFRLGAEKVVNIIRGLNPNPGVYMNTENGVIKVYRAKICEGGGKPGEILCADGKRGLKIACAEGAVEILTLKPQNGKEMEAKAYLLGKKLTVGGFVGE